MRYARGGRRLERLAGTGRSGASGGRTPRRWRPRHDGPDPWAAEDEGADLPWLRGRGPSLAREALQQGLLFPATRIVANPRVVGADDLLHAPQPAVIAPNHSSDIDTPLVLDALPRSWRTNTVVGAASDRFYRRRRYAVASALWINTFPFDRRGELRGLATAAEFLREGRNVLLYPQGTRSSGLEGFRAGVGRLCVLTGAPLVPVGVSGTALLMPKGRGLVGRGRSSVHFGRALYPEPGEAPQAFAERAAQAVAALAGERR